MAIPEWGFGYLLIDVFLTGSLVYYYLYTRDPQRIAAKHLAVIHAVFIALHFYASEFDMSADLFGVERSHHYMYALGRNLIFKATLLYVILFAGLRLAFLHWPPARKAAFNALRRWYALKRTPALAAAALLKRFPQAARHDKQKY